MPDDDDITLAEAIRSAGIRDAKALYTAARSGRLKTVTSAAGAHAVRLTTRAWLREYLDSTHRAT